MEDEQKPEGREIEVPGGTMFDTVVQQLLEAKARGEKAYAKFNGQYMTSDSVNEHTIEDRRRLEQEELRDYYARRDAMYDELRANEGNFLEQGKEIIFPERHEAWEKFVSDSYVHGFGGREVRWTLEVLQALAQGATLEEAKEVIADQGHSTSTYYYVADQVLHFSNRGPDFYSFVAPELVNDRKQEIEEIRNENKVLGELHPQLVFEERKVEEATPEAKEPEKVEPEKTESEKTEPEKSEPEKTEPEKIEPEKSEPEKVEPVKPEPVKPERLQQMIMDYKKASLEHVPFKTFFSAYNQTEKKALLAALQIELKKRSEARKKAAEKTTEEPAIQQPILTEIKPVVHETFPKGYEDLPSWDKKTVQSVVDSRNLEKDKEHLSNLVSAITEAMGKSMQADKPVEPVTPTVEAPSEEVSAPEPAEPEVVPIEPESMEPVTSTVEAPSEEVSAPEPVEPEVVPIEPESMEPATPTVEAPTEEVSAPEPVAESETTTKEDDIVSKYGNLPSWEQEYLKKIAAYNAGKQNQDALNRQAVAEMVDAMANNPSETATDDKTVEGPHL